MEQSFKSAAEALRLPSASRERIRASRAAAPAPSAQEPERRTVRRVRIPRLAAAVVLILTLSITAAAAVSHYFRNSILVSDENEIPSDLPVVVTTGAPLNPAEALTEEKIARYRVKSDDWSIGEEISGGVLSGYVLWDSTEVLSSDPSLRIRRTTRQCDDAVKMEYTAENPAVLPAQLSGRATLSLDWLAERYDYVPDANSAFLVTDGDGSFVSDFFLALYRKPDSDAYFALELTDIREPDYYARSYVVDGEFEDAYYYTTPDGCEYLITLDSGHVSAECTGTYSYFNLTGAFLTKAETEALLDSLHLRFNP